MTDRTNTDRDKSDDTVPDATSPDNTDSDQAQNTYQPQTPRPRYGSQEAHWLQWSAMLKAHPAPTPEQVAAAEQRFKTINDKFIADNVAHVDFALYKAAHEPGATMEDADKMWHVYPTDESRHNTYYPDQNSSEFAEWNESKTILESLWDKQNMALQVSNIGQALTAKGIDLVQLEKDWPTSGGMNNYIFDRQGNQVAVPPQMSSNPRTLQNEARDYVWSFKPHPGMNPENIRDNPTSTLAASAAQYNAFQDKIQNLGYNSYSYEDTGDGQGTTFHLRIGPKNWYFGQDVGHYMATDWHEAQSGWQAEERRRRLPNGGILQEPELAAEAENIGANRDLDFRISQANFFESFEGSIKAFGAEPSMFLADNSEMREGNFRGKPNMDAFGDSVDLSDTKAAQGVNDSTPESATTEWGRPKNRDDRRDREKVFPSERRAARVAEQLQTQEDLMSGNYETTTDFAPPKDYTAMRGHELMDAYKMTDANLIENRDAYILTLRARSLENEKLRAAEGLTDAPQISGRFVGLVLHDRGPVYGSGGLDAAYEKVGLNVRIPLFLQSEIDPMGYYISRGGGNADYGKGIAAQEFMLKVGVWNELTGRYDKIQNGQVIQRAQAERLTNGDFATSTEVAQGVPLMSSEDLGNAYALNVARLHDGEPTYSGNTARAIDYANPFMVAGLTPEQQKIALTVEKYVDGWNVFPKDTIGPQVDQKIWQNKAIVDGIRYMPSVPVADAGDVRSIINSYAGATDMVKQKALEMIGNHEVNVTVRSAGEILDYASSELIKEGADRSTVYKYSQDGTSIKFASTSEFIIGNTPPSSSYLDAHPEAQATTYSSSSTAEKPEPASYLTNQSLDNTDPNTDIPSYKLNPAPAQPDEPVIRIPGSPTPTTIDNKRIIEINASSASQAVKDKATIEVLSGHTSTAADLIKWFEAGGPHSEAGLRFKEMTRILNEGTPQERANWNNFLAANSTAQTNRPNYSVPPPMGSAGSGTYDPNSSIPPAIQQNSYIPDTNNPLYPGS